MVELNTGDVLEVTWNVTINYTHIPLWVRVLGLALIFMSLIILAKFEGGTYDYQGMYGR